MDKLTDLTTITLEQSEKDLVETTKKAEQRIELKKCDETGAIKESFFHTRINEILRNHVNVDKDGRFFVDPKSENLNFLSVSVRDLARVNKEGTHLEGDAVLQKCVTETLSGLSSAGIQDAEIYHLVGADFIVICNVSEDKIKDISRKLTDTTIEFSEHAEPGHVSVSPFPLSKIVEYSNERISSSDTNNPDNRLYDISGNPTKFMTGVVMRSLRMGAEYSKLLDTTIEFKRLYESETSERQQMQDHYEMYIKYLFTFSNIQTAEDLADLEPAQIERLCFFSAFEKVYADGPIPYRILRTQLTGLNEEADNTFWEMEEARKSSPNKVSTLLQQNFETQEKIYRTEESLKLEKIFNLYQDLQENSPEKLDIDDWEKCKELITILESFDVFKRSYSQNLEKHTLMIDKLIESAQKYGKTTQEWTYLNHRNLILSAAALGIKEILTEYDPMTGLRNKEQYKDYLKTLYETGNNFSVISLDMAFLKYYNAYGGRNTVGNLAIRKAAHILKSVQEDYLAKGIKARVFRTGGDEYSVVASLPEEDIKEIGAEIQTASHELGPIPQSTESKEDYQPENLRFNMGIIDMVRAKNLLQKVATEHPEYLSENEVAALTAPNPTPEQEILTENLTLDTLNKAVDLIQERVKVSDRFVFMFKKYVSMRAGREYEEMLETEEFRKFDGLLTFSGKALQSKTINDFERIYKFANEKGISPADAGKDNMAQLTQEFYNESGRETNGEQGEAGKMTGAINNQDQAFRILGIPEDLGSLENIEVLIKLLRK